MLQIFFSKRSSGQWSILFSDMSPKWKHINEICLCNRNSQHLLWSSRKLPKIAFSLILSLFKLMCCIKISEYQSICKINVREFSKFRETFTNLSNVRLTQAVVQWEGIKIFTYSIFFNAYEGTFVIFGQPGSGHFSHLLLLHLSLSAEII